MADQIALVLRAQRVSSSFVAWGLFLVGPGAALFLLSQVLWITRTIPGQVYSLAGWIGAGMVAVASLALLLHPGMPGLFFSCLSQPRKSWLAVGPWVISLFGAVALATLLPSLPGLAGFPWPDDTLAAKTLQGAAAVLALALLAYMALLATSCSPRPFWSTRYLPLLFVAYSLLGGIGATLVLTTAMGRETHSLNLLALAHVVAVAAILVCYLATMWGRGGATEQSVRFLLMGDESGPFIVGVLVVGLYVPAVLLATDVSLGLHSSMLLFAAGVAMLLGACQVWHSLPKAAACGEKRSDEATY